jgi:hypothetical protein
VNGNISIREILLFAVILAAISICAVVVQELPGDFQKAQRANETAVVSLTQTALPTQAPTPLLVTQREEFLPPWVSVDMENVEAGILVGIYENSFNNTHRSTVVFLDQANPNVWDDIYQTGDELIDLRNGVANLKRADGSIYHVLPQGYQIVEGYLDGPRDEAIAPNLELEFTNWAKGLYFKRNATCSSELVGTVDWEHDYYVFLVSGEYVFVSAEVTGVGMGRVVVTPTNLDKILPKVKLGEDLNNNPVHWYVTYQDGLPFWFALSPGYFVDVCHAEVRELDLNQPVSPIAQGE